MATTRRHVVMAGGGGALAACGAPGAGRGEVAGSSRGPQEVTWSIYGDQTTRPFFDAITNRFNEQKAGKFTATLNLVAGSEYIDKTLAALAADAPSDVFLTYAQYKPAWVKKGLLLDATDRFKSSRVVNSRMYYPPVVDAITYKGRQYGTPWGYNATMIFLVLDRFRERNIPLPSANWTMQDYAALAKRLNDPEKGVFGAGSNPAATAGQSMFSLMWNYGRHYWVNDDETRSLVNSEPAIEMFRFFQDLQFKDQSFSWSGNPAKPGFGFSQGAFAMSFQYTSVASFSLIDTFQRQGQTFEWRMHTFPRGPRDQQHFSQGHIWTIAKTHR